jgi:hypothetical protein
LKSSEKNNFKKIYFLFLVINFIFFLLEFLLINYVNYQIVFFWQKSSANINRFSGIMSEPSQNMLIHFPLIFMNSKYKKIFMPIIIIITFLSGSATFLGFFIIFLFYYLIEEKKYYIIILIVLFIMIFMFFLNDSLLVGELSITERLTSISIKEGSTFSRVFKQFYLLKDMKFIEILFGNGLGNVSILMENYVGDFSSLVKLEDFIAGFGNNIISYGLLISLVIYYFLYKIIKNNNDKIILYCFILLICFTFFLGISFNNYLFYSLLILTDFLKETQVNVR